MIQWVRCPDVTCPAGWPTKSEYAKVGKFSLRVRSWSRDMKWDGILPGVCCTGNYDDPEKAKAALLKLVRRAPQNALSELEGTP